MEVASGTAPMSETPDSSLLDFCVCLEQSWATLAVEAHSPTGLCPTCAVLLLVNLGSGYDKALLSCHIGAWVFPPW
jgi:hypothetical protein